MRLKFKLITSLSTTTAEEKDQWNRDPGTIHETSDVFREGGPRTIRLASGLTNQEIDFGGIDDVGFILITTDRTISIRRDGGDAMTIDIPDGWDIGYHLHTGPLESLTVTNASGYTATIKIYLAGDPS